MPVSSKSTSNDKKDLKTDSSEAASKEEDANETTDVEEVGEEKYNSGKFELATKLFSDMIQKDDFDEFLTLPAYQFI